MSINKMWNSAEEFRSSLDEGVKLLSEEGPLSADPANDDKPILKSLLATYLTGVFDPEKLMDPELSSKLLVIRMTLLAAYNQGRASSKFVKLTCGDKVRHVRNIEVNPKSLGCSLVNNGHDDLFDLGFTVEELSAKGLKIE